MVDTVLAAQNISLSYRSKGVEKPVLSDFSMQLEAGEITAILGFSGSGKSSLLRVLAGLNKPSSGNVLVRDNQIRKPHPRIGFMFQDACLLPWLDLAANVEFGLKLKSQKKISKAERKQRVADALAEVGLTDAAKERPAALSGGMAQRGSLARSLVRQPDILLLDEPFSALDAVTRQQMQQLLVQVARRHNTAVVLVTHDIDEALQVADNVLLLGGSQPSTLAASWDLTHVDKQANSSALKDIHQQIVNILRYGVAAPADPLVDELVAIPA